MAQAWAPKSRYGNPPKAHVHTTQLHGAFGQQDLQDLRPYHYPLSCLLREKSRDRTGGPPLPGQAVELHTVLLVWFLGTYYT